MNIGTRTINLRDLPEELVRRAKACAALNGLTLRDYVIQAINNAVRTDLEGAVGLAAFAEPASTQKKGRKKQ